MTVAAIIASVGFFLVCLAKGFSLLIGAHLDLMESQNTIRMKEQIVPCPMCNYVNDVVGPEDLAVINCGECGSEFNLNWQKGE